MRPGETTGRNDSVRETAEAVFRKITIDLLAIVGKG
jgi:hypothetical protein